MSLNFWMIVLTNNEFFILESFMPQGKGTYGSKVGRPPKKKKPAMMHGGMAAKKAKPKMMYGGMAKKKK